MAESVSDTISLARSPEDDAKLKELANALEPHSDGIRNAKPPANLYVAENGEVRLVENDPSAKKVNVIEPVAIGAPSLSGVEGIGRPVATASFGLNFGFNPPTFGDIFPDRKPSYGDGKPIYLKDSVHVGPCEYILTLDGSLYTLRVYFNYDPDSWMYIGQDIRLTAGRYSLGSWTGRIPKEGVDIPAIGVMPPPLSVALSVGGNLRLNESEDRLEVRYFVKFFGLRWELPAVITL